MQGKRHLRVGPRHSHGRLHHDEGELIPPLPTHDVGLSGHGAPHSTPRRALRIAPRLFPRSSLPGPRHSSLSDCDALPTPPLSDCRAWLLTLDLAAASLKASSHTPLHTFRNAISHLQTNQAAVPLLCSPPAFFCVPGLTITVAGPLEQGSPRWRSRGGSYAPPAVKDPFRPLRQGETRASGTNALRSDCVQSAGMHRMDCQLQLLSLQPWVLRSHVVDAYSPSRPCPHDRL